MELFKNIFYLEDDEKTYDKYKCYNCGEVFDYHFDLLNPSNIMCCIDVPYFVNGIFFPRVIGYQIDDKFHFTYHSDVENKILSNADYYVLNDVNDIDNKIILLEKIAKTNKYRDLTCKLNIRYKNGDCDVGDYSQYIDDIDAMCLDEHQNKFFHKLMNKTGNKDFLENIGSRILYADELCENGEIEKGWRLVKEIKNQYFLEIKNFYKKHYNKYVEYLENKRFNIKLKNEFKTKLDDLEKEFEKY